MVKIEVKGKENLSSEEASFLENSINSNREKILREIENVSEIDITIKKYHEEGNSHQYSVNISVINSHRKFSADAIGWQFSVVLKDTFNKILTQVKHFIENKR